MFEKQKKPEPIELVCKRCQKTFKTLNKKRIYCPACKPGKKRKPIVFSYEEIKELILNINDNLDRFILAVAYANGCRVGELKGLLAKDIDIDEEFIYITTPVLKKQGGIVPKRNPPISRIGEPWLAAIIMDFAANKNPDDLLIPYSKRTIQYRFQQYADCTSHSFRHTRAMHMLRHFKMSMEKIRLFFGLSAYGLVSWIAKYGHLDTEDLKAHYRDLGLVKKKEVKLLKEQEASSESEKNK